MKKSLEKIVRLIGFGIFFLLYGCTLVDNSDTITVINNGYESKAVSDILNGTCGTSACHGGSSPVNGLSTEIQAQLMLGSTNRPFESVKNYGGDVVIPYKPDQSLLMQFVKGNITSKTSYNHSTLSKSEISTLSDWIIGGAKSDKEIVPYESPESYRVFVCNSESESISIIDGTSNVVGSIAQFDTSNSKKNIPYWIVEYGNYLYVSLSEANKLLKIRKSDKSLVGVTNNLYDAGLIKLNPSGSKAYVSRNYNSNTNYNSIYVINTSDMSIKTTISLPFTGVLNGLAYDLTRDYLYIADALNNMVHVVNTLTDVLIDVRYSLTTNYYPLFIEISPDGNYLYISANNTNQLLVVNTLSRIVVDRLSLLPNPMGIVVSSDGTKIYVASSGGNSVEVVTKTNNFWNKTNTISHATMSMPFAMDLTSNGSDLYLTNQNSNSEFIPTYLVDGEKNTSTITIINTSTETVSKVIEVEEGASGLVVEN